MALQSQAITCVNCKADFSNPSGWKPLLKQLASKEQSTKSTIWKLLRVLLIIVGVLALLFCVAAYTALSSGYIGGH
jgi:hypothetical protein